MITGELKNKIDKIWDTFWTGGISNPLEVIEQITSLLFIRRLDDLHTRAENKANRLKKPIEGAIFPIGQDDLRWSRFKHFEPAIMFKVVDERVFPFLRQLGGDGSTYSHHMKDARFTIPTPALLSRVVDMIDHVPMQDRDTNGDLYEYMLSKIASAGANGQFRTPRHIIQLMVEMTAPGPRDKICDPACGTAGFLVLAGEYVRDNNPSVLVVADQRKHFHHEMFHGFDFDSTMLRIGSMNMLLHGIENPDIRYRDSLSESVGGDEDMYSLILANPPFAGSVDNESTSKVRQRVVKTKKTELLFLAACERNASVLTREALRLTPPPHPSDPQFFSAYTWASLSRHVSRAIVAVPAARPPNSHGCQDWFSPGISWNQLDPPPRRIRVPIRSGQG